MRYSKSLEFDTCERDAALVDEIHQKYKTLPSPANEKALFGAQEWFGKKHKCAWQDFVQAEEKQR